MIQVAEENKENQPDPDGSTDAAQMRMISLQTLVTVAECANTLAQGKDSDVKKDVILKVNQKIFFQYQLFSYLVSRCTQMRTEFPLSKDETILVARCFASVPITMLVQVNLPILEQGPPQTDIEKTLTQTSLVGYFQALASLLHDQKDS